MDKLVVDALWLKEPWLTLVLDGIKTIETRTRNTNKRGIIFLGASKTVDWDAFNHFTRQGIAVHNGPLGCLRGRVLLRDSWLMRKEDEAAAMCPATPGRYAWRVNMPARLQMTIPARGMLGIFRLPIPDEYADEVRALI